MFKEFKKDFYKKVRAAASNQQQPTMYNSIYAFEEPPVAPMGIENRAMYKKGGYMMGGSPMTDQMQGQMKKKMWKPYDRSNARPDEKENDRTSWWLCSWW
jgi:hypothetical protein